MSDQVREAYGMGMDAYLYRMFGHQIRKSSDGASGLGIEVSDPRLQIWYDSAYLRDPKYRAPVSICRCRARRPQQPPPPLHEGKVHLRVDDRGHLQPFAALFEVLLGAMGIGSGSSDGELRAIVQC